MDNIEEQLSDALFEGDDTEEGESLETPEEPKKAPETFKFGEKEYTQDELTRLIELGQIGIEAEERFKTPIDKVWPKYQQMVGKVNEYEKELEIYHNTVKDQNKPLLPENEEQAIKEAREAARKLGLVTNEDFEGLLNNSFRSYYEKERAAEKLLDTASSYEKEIDGTDGRPAFKAERVLTYMVENGLSTDLMTAYKLMNEDALDSWKESQLTKAKKPGLRTQDVSTAGGDKVPTDVKPNKDNLEDLVREALEGKI